MYCLGPQGPVLCIWSLIRSSSKVFQKEEPVVITSDITKKKEKKFEGLSISIVDKVARFVLFMLSTNAISGKSFLALKKYIWSGEKDLPLNDLLFCTNITMQIKYWQGSSQPERR